MPSRYRAKFINSLSGFKSANLIGTQNANGQTNLAIFSSVVHLGASPALVAFVMRPDNNDRHTLDNILTTKHYTINQVSTDFYQGAHQSSARYDKSDSEFLHSGLSTSYVEGIYAPFVKESNLKYAVTLKEIMPITLNNTQFIIGEITHVICADVNEGSLTSNNTEVIIQPDGYIDIEALNTVSISGLDSYHKSSRLSRLSYATTENSLMKLALSGDKLNTADNETEK
jgi:flavin reductase (DIM6/NTAB) family NADH-FMN oxidoreductase RutF